MRTAATWVLYAGLALAMGGGAPWPRPSWTVVAVGLLTIAIGVGMERAATRRAGPRLHAGADSGIAAARAALEAMTAQLRALLAELATLPLAELATRIERLQIDGTERVAAAQNDFVRDSGFAAYAAVMGPLATGERWLYRAWSAASDGHRAEAVASVEAALPFVEAACAELRARLAAPAAGQ